MFKLNFRKLSITLFAIMFAAILAFPTLVWADDRGHAYVNDLEACDFVDNVTADDLCTVEDENHAFEVVGNVLSAIYGIIGVLAVIMIVVAGIKYMTSQGDPGKIQSAKQTITYAIIGLVITILAFAITNFILYALGANSGSGSGTPAGAFAPEISSLYVESPKSSIKENEKVQLDVSYEPANAKNATFSYESSDSNIATVGRTGRIYAQSPGTVTITVKSSNGKTETIDIKILEIVKPSSVSITPAEVTLKEGEKKTLTAKVLPDDAEDKSASWSSSNTNVATVSESGEVVAKKEGTAVITVKTKINNKTATATVKVEKKEVDPTANAGDRHKLGSALAVMHAANNGDLNKVQQAVNKKYYAVECDMQVRGSTIYCYHDSNYTSNNTLAETVRIAKAGGTRVILDHVYDNYDLLANYIKSNNLQKWIIIQIGASGAANKMTTINNAVGTKMEYWGLFMSGSTSDFTRNASTLKSLGMTTINAASGGSYSSYSNEASFRAFKNAGFEMCVFTWVSFSNSSISTFTGRGAKYLMTDSVSQ